MSQVTNIAWTAHTQNFWTSCAKISPGCTNCYMFTAMKRIGRDPTKITRTKTWGDPYRWQRKLGADQHELVFTCSWSDFFIKEADAWRDEAWKVIRETPNLWYQILTKRPERIADHLPADWGSGGYPNVWLGVSAENQKYYDRRWSILGPIPAVVRFISYEPALGPIEICAALTPDSKTGKVFPDWLIYGGESGPGFRTADVAWARSVRDQCKEIGIAFFHKQSSGPRSEMGIELDGKIVREYPTPRQVKKEFTLT